MDNCGMNQKKNKKYANRVNRIKPPKIRKPQTFMARSILILLIFACIEAFLGICLYFVDDLSVYFEWIIKIFEKIENFILQYMDLKNILFVFLIMFLIYFIKAYLPFLPLSIVCMMTGTVFNKYWWAALLVNMLGIGLMFYLRFNSGRVKGENYMQNLLRRSKNVRMALDVNGASSYSLLAVFRFFPCFPINFVSRLYGANKDCKFHWYMLISMASIAPRIYIYTSIGREIFNPFTTKFVMLIMLFCALSGLGTFIVNFAFYLKRRNDEKEQSAVIEKLRHDSENEMMEESEPEIGFTPSDKEYGKS